MNRCRQRRLSASVISRALFEVSMTNGTLRRAQGAQLGHGHLEVGEHLEQERLELGVGASISSMSRTPRCGERIARSSGRGRMKRSEKKTSSCAASLSTASASVAAPASHLADLVAQDLGVEELLGVLPLVERLGLVEPLVALQADQLGAERRRPAPWRARSCRRRPAPRRGSASPCDRRGRRRWRCGDRRRRRARAGA